MTGTLYKDISILQYKFSECFWAISDFQKGIYPMLFAPEEKGQGLVEYAIILALIAIVVIAVMTTLGKKVNNTFNSIGNSLTV